MGNYLEFPIILFFQFGCLLCSFDLDAFDVEFLADIRGFALAVAVWTVEGEKLLGEQFAALVAAELRLDSLDAQPCALAEGVFGDHIEVDLDGFSHVSGVVSYDQIYCENTLSAVVTAMFFGYFDYVFCYR